MNGGRICEGTYRILRRIRLCETGYDIGGGGHITYCDKLPAIYIWVDSPEVEYEKRVFFKERHWEFEREYRLNKTWPLSAIDYEVERNIQLPEGCIVSVICGRNIKPSDMEALKRIVAVRHPKARFLQEE